MNTINITAVIGHLKHQVLLAGVKFYITINKELKLLGSVQTQLHTHVNMFICKPLDYINTQNLKWLTIQSRTFSQYIDSYHSSPHILYCMKNKGLLIISHYVTRYKLTLGKWQVFIPHSNMPKKNTSILYLHAPRTLNTTNTTSYISW